MEAVLNAQDAPGLQAGQAPAAAPNLMAESVGTIEEAIEGVIREAHAVGGVRAGLNQVMKACEGQQAQVIFLAADIEAEEISRAIKNISTFEKRQIPIIEVPEAKKLGEWAGLCKIDNDGQARGIVGASCVCITDYGTTTGAYDYLQKHIKDQGGDRKTVAV